MGGACKREAQIAAWKAEPGHLGQAAEKQEMEEGYSRQGAAGSCSRSRGSKAAGTMV